MADLDKLEKLAKAVPDVDRGVTFHVKTVHESARFQAFGPAAELMFALYQKHSELIALARRDGVEEPVAVTADTVRNTITRFLTADDPTHWGEFERRLAVAVGMTPSTTEDACMGAGFGCDLRPR